MKRLILTLGIVALSSASFGQKGRITDAALEYKKLHSMLYTLPTRQDIPGAKKSVLLAKGYIDQAAVHPDTKENQKMFLYKGQIYFALSMLLEMDSSLTTVSSDDALDTSLKAWEMGLNLGKKYKMAIQDAANEKRQFASMIAGEMWKNEKYLEAGEAYEVCAMIANSIGVVDSVFIFNAAIAYDNGNDLDNAIKMYDQLAAMNYQEGKGAQLSGNAYLRAKNYDKAIEILSKARKDYPGNKEVLLGLVNANIAAGNTEGAEKALKDAIADDSTNPRLHYANGTIYLELKRNQEAEDALRRAIELDPDYALAKYQLGAHLVNWAFELKTELGLLGMNDPKEAELTVKANEKMDGAIEALESYLVNDEKNIDVLKILKKAYRKQGNKAKSDEVQTRIDAI
ncbi:MAG: tetratricopeptide repeat protein [Crocinitomicaceae bacterium]|nr:tetratricopeptide repeat protein [Crocinitomicaceae bacterium]